MAAHKPMQPLIWEASRAERTKAMPRHSLFGTALEVFDDQDRLQIDKIDTKAYGRQKQSTRKESLPDYLRAKLADKDAMEQSRSRLEIQKEAVRRARFDLKSQEQAALAFRSTPPNAEQQVIGAIRHYPKWFTQQDLQGSKNVNAVGLSSKGSYNWDKYRRRPPVHTYSIMGDVLKPGMEFNGVNDVHSAPSGQSVPQPPKLQTVPEQPIEKSLQDYVTTPIVDLPPNIRHAYGSRICDNLLADRKKVTDILDKQREISARRKRPRPEVPKFSSKTNEVYESLGLITRGNMFSGYSVDNSSGLFKEVYNDEVHLKRVPDTDEFRYQRDELSTWAEQNVLRDRVKKAWDQAYMDKAPTKKE